MSERALADDMLDTAREALEASKESAEITEEIVEEPIEDTEEPVEEVDELDGEEQEGEESEIVPDEPEESEDQEQEVVAEVEEEDPKFLNAPDTWRAEPKSKWKDLPAWAKEEIYKREDDTKNGISQYKEKADFGDRMDRTILPYQPILQQRGLSPEQAVGESLQFIHVMSTGTPEQKGVILQNLAQMYGADLTVTQDENALQMQRQLQPLYQELNQLRQHSQQYQQQAQAQLESEINSFATQVDESGNLAHPYFSNVRDLMASLIESGQAEGLEQAYQIAIKAHPDTSGIIESEQAARKEAERQERAKKKTEKAKRNDAVNVSKKGHHTETSEPVGTIEDTAKKALEAIKSRAA